MSQAPRSPGIPPELAVSAVRVIALTVARHATNDPARVNTFADRLHRELQPHLRHDRVIISMASATVQALIKRGNLTPPAEAARFAVVVTAEGIVAGEFDSGVTFVPYAGPQLDAAGIDRAFQDYVGGIARGAGDALAESRFAGIV